MVTQRMIVIERIKLALCYLLLGWFALGVIFSPRNGPVEGAECGAGYHWVYLGYDYLGDLSCEEDR